MSYWGGRGHFNQRGNSSSNMRFGLLPLVRPPFNSGPNHFRGGGRGQRGMSRGGMGSWRNQNVRYHNNMPPRNDGPPPRHVTPRPGQVVRMGPSKPVAPKDTAKVEKVEDKKDEKPKIEEKKDSSKDDKKTESVSKDKPQENKEKTDEKKEEVKKPEVTAANKDATVTEVIPTKDIKEEFPKPIITLDRSNSELHLVMNEQLLVAENMTGPGFEYMWAGARANYGVKSGKVCFEVHILQNIKVKCDGEKNPHVCRLGWSVDNSDYQLGEDKLSWGYGGTAKSSYNSKFLDYGRKYGVGDTITCYVDLDATPKAIFFALNGQYLGVAFRFTNELNKKPLFPHISLKNMKVKMNFGGEAPKFPLTSGFKMIQEMPHEELYLPSPSPQTREEAEIIMMVGLPACGKSYWCEQYAKDNPVKKYYILGTNSIIDRMKVTGLTRKRNYHGRWEELIKRASAVLNKLFNVAKNLPRNYILDQTNVYPTARKRKMGSFDRYKRIAIVIVNKPEVLADRTTKQRKIEGKEIPEAAIMEMKANFTLPEVGPSFDEVRYIEEKLPLAEKLVAEYRSEGSNYKKNALGNAKRQKLEESKPIKQQNIQSSNFKTHAPAKASMDSPSAQSKMMPRNNEEKNQSQMNKKPESVKEPVTPKQPINRGLNPPSNEKKNTSNTAPKNNEKDFPAREDSRRNTSSTPSSQRSFEASRSSRDRDSFDRSHRTNELKDVPGRKENLNKRDEYDERGRYERRDTFDSRGNFDRRGDSNRRGGFDQREDLPKKDDRPLYRDSQRRNESPRGRRDELLLRGHSSREFSPRGRYSIRRSEGSFRDDKPITDSVDNYSYRSDSASRRPYGRREDNYSIQQHDSDRRGSYSQREPASEKPFHSSDYERSVLRPTREDDTRARSSYDRVKPNDPKQDFFYDSSVRGPANVDRDTRRSGVPLVQENRSFREREPFREPLYPEKRVDDRTYGAKQMENTQDYVQGRPEPSDYRSRYGLPTDVRPHQSLPTSQNSLQEEERYHHNFPNNQNRFSADDRNRQSFSANQSNRPFNTPGNNTDNQRQIQQDQRYSSEGNQSTFPRTDRYDNSQSVNTFREERFSRTPIKREQGPGYGSQPQQERNSGPQNQDYFDRKPPALMDSSFDEKSFTRMSFNQGTQQFPDKGNQRNENPSAYRNQQEASAQRQPYPPNRERSFQQEVKTTPSYAKEGYQQRQDNPQRGFEGNRGSQYMEEQQGRQNIDQRGYNTSFKQDLDNRKQQPNQSFGGRQDVNSRYEDRGPNSVHRPQQGRDFQQNRSFQEQNRKFEEQDRSFQEQNRSFQGQSNRTSQQNLSYGRQDERSIQGQRNFGGYAERYSESQSQYGSQETRAQYDNYSQQKQSYYENRDLRSNSSFNDSQRRDESYYQGHRRQDDQNYRYDQQDQRGSRYGQGCDNYPPDRGNKSSRDEIPYSSSSSYHSKGYSYISSSNQANDRMSSSSHQPQMTTSTANYNQPVFNTTSRQENSFQSGNRGGYSSKEASYPGSSYEEKDRYQSSNYQKYSEQAPPQSNIPPSNAPPSRPTVDGNDPSYEKQQEDYQRAYSQWYANYAQAFAQLTQQNQP